MLFIWLNVHFCVLVCGGGSCVWRTVWEELCVGGAVWGSCVWGAVGKLCVGSCESGICVVGSVWGMSVGRGSCVGDVHVGATACLLCSRYGTWQKKISVLRPYVGT